ncbi:HPP family protein [Leucobacter allii]|uniref:HPP family protein n=1 Tax=Leucobacter allii TaxID=2932247 RepID=UPI001FD0C611|nr:HPP family protein [Leucobacter allii]UOR00837.1 HPP family protein [Leucobacter allii]
MSKGPKPGKPEQPTPQARRKQIIVGLVMGAVVGVVIGALTQFWLWVPAGLALGLATGAIMKPPAA